MNTHKPCNMPQRATRIWLARRRLIRLSSWLIAGGIGFGGCAIWLFWAGTDPAGLYEPGAEPTNWGGLLAIAAALWSIAAAVRLEGTLWNFPVDYTNVQTLYALASILAKERRLEELRRDLPPPDLEFTPEDERLLR